MTRATPPRPLDVEAVFPALAAHRRTTTRLHPRHGSPGTQDSSVAGPLLWPADEPWPVCTAVHPKGTGHLLSDVRLSRRILEDSRGREYTAEEQRLIDGMTAGNHLPELRDDAPLPMLAVAQLYAHEIPDLVGPEDHDLLQVFWCPFEVHGTDRTIDVVLKWRRSTDVGAVLMPQPEPPVVGRKECVPNMCVVHPERVVEHEYLGLLEEELQEEIDEWEEARLDEDDADEYNSAPPASYATYEEYEEAMAAAEAAEPEEINYMSDLSIAPGWKVGGFASWHLTDPAPVGCEVCGAAMPPLLTVNMWECDGASRSWLPIEDRDGQDPYATNPTEVYLGRGLMRVHTCLTDPAHPHRLSFQ
ncbi:hypothetical protein OG279_37885 (plasmid) [Streptomyces sp. NBC_01201]|uniref:LigA protein n=1 Tax=Streptomyces glycanivorans TaxID=3033808 RepID=A0ABY9JTA8_9ACTN|nr:hypothetical protein [Streptomyces sp. Alt3]WLQ69241.1 hypothetical protein P8A20_37545 [Streptomyces sp. Alt3]WSR53374.1 hypothetical protein OG279_37885 [Streptomyces sp. NBC_01201]